MVTLKSFKSIRSAGKLAEHYRKKKFARPALWTRCRQTWFGQTCGRAGKQTDAQTETETETDTQTGLTKRVYIVPFKPLKGYT